VTANVFKKCNTLSHFQHWVRRVRGLCSTFASGYVRKKLPSSEKYLKMKRSLKSL